MATKVNDHIFLFTVLLELVRQDGKKNLSISYDSENNTLFLNENALPFEGKGYTEAELEDRLHFLAMQLGIQELTVPHANIALRSLLKDRGAATPGEIVDVIKSSTLRKDSSGDTIKLWRQALEMRVLKAGFSHMRVEWLQEAPAEDRKEYLESGPLLEKWPKSLLEDTFWAYTEPGFPGTEPFRLDEIWTDLNLINPQEESEFFGNTLESSFTQLLDYRYELRQWRTKPAEFVMEQLQGTVAIIGPPGSGKTTLMKWLARKLIMNPDGYFLLPLFVPLRQYAQSHNSTNNNGTNIIDYALQTAGVSSQQQRQLWQSFLTYLAGSQKDNVLLLLDGWDEVPANRRDALKKELLDLAHNYSYVITSRPSAYPKTLPTDRFYEIAELSWDSIYKLVTQWFEIKKEPAMAASVLQYLDKYPDLKRLARNPFLLSLLCSYTFFRHNSPNMKLPRNRTQLYRHSVLSIIQQHNARFPQYPFEKEKYREVEQLAYWLFTAAPSAPSYTFDLEDIEKTGGNKKYMEKTLKPARFITRNDHKNESYHFLHTTFQEYFAACHITRKEPNTIKKIFGGIAFDSTWQEIFSFAAGFTTHSDTLSRLFWQCMKENAATPDRFGFVYIQLSRFLAEAGIADGGSRLLGVNLLEKLWQFIISEEKINHYVDAYTRLDATGYVQKVKDYTTQPDASPRTEAKLLRSLGRVKTSDTSDEAVRQILKGKKDASEHVSFQLDRVLNSKGLQVLLTEAVNRERPVVERKRIVNALGKSDRMESLNVLSDIARSTEESTAIRDEAIKAIGQIGGDSGVECLKTLFEEKKERSVREKILYALSHCKCLRARDFLLSLLAEPSIDQTLTAAILEALYEIPINRGSEMLLGFLKHPVPGIRSAAASALANAAPTKGHITDVLMKAAQNDQELAVRIQALLSLENRARPSDARALARLIESEKRPDGEKANALRALVLTASRCRNLPDGPWLNRLAFNVLQKGLKQKQGDLVLEAVQLAYLFSKDIEPILLKILKDDSYSQAVREWAVNSLGKLKSSTVEPLFLELLNAFPNTRGDEEETETHPGKRLAQRAAQALTHINPSALLNLKGSTAHNALADFALESGLLVYNDRIMDTLEKDVSGIWNEKEDLKSTQTYPEQGNKGTPKKKILFLSANKVGEEQLHLDREFRNIEDALVRSKNRDRLELFVKLAVRYQDIRRGLLDYEPEILHFSGHGSEQGVEVLDEVGAFTNTVSNQEISQLLEIFKEKVVCAIFSSCDSNRLADTVVKHIPYVIGMKEDIPDNASIAFSSAFYDGIGAGSSIEDAFKLGCLAIETEEDFDENTHSIPVLKKRDCESL